MNDIIQQRTRLQLIGLILGPILFFLMLSLDLDPDKPIVTSMAAVAVLMATWWITEAIPLAATAILPVYCSLCWASCPVKPLRLCISTVRFSCSWAAL